MRLRSDTAFRLPSGGVGSLAPNAVGMAEMKKKRRNMFFKLFKNSVGKKIFFT
jgi:hypothetical protein